MTEFLKPEVKKMLMQNAGNIQDAYAQQVRLDGRLTELRDGLDRVSQDIDINSNFVTDHFKMISLDLKQANAVIAKQERTQRVILAVSIAVATGIVALLFL